MAAQDLIFIKIWWN